MQCQLLSDRGGGLASAVLPLAQRVARSAEISILSPEPPCDEWSGPPVTRLSSIGPMIFGARAALLRLDTEIVHTHGLWSPLSAAALAWRRRSGRPTVVSPHGMLDAWALRKSAAKKRLALALYERSHLASAAFVHALNDAEAEAVRALGIRTPIAIMPNGVDSDPPRPVAPAFMDRPTLLFLGRLTPKKGVSELIAAFGLAAPRLPGWRLALAGWQDEAADYRAEAAASGADIVFPGPLFGDDKAAAYANASAFVLPSHSEGLPITVLEAWAAKCPVLMTRACNLPEGFINGAAAQIDTEPATMAEVLVRRLSDEGWRRATGVAGERLVRRAFGWDGIADTFVSLYEYALHGGVRPKVLHD